MTFAPRFALVIALTPMVAGATSLSLSGTDWSIQEANVPGAQWIPARVPGNIQADLEAAHRIGPLWYGAGDPRLAEVAKKDWRYRKEFMVPAGFRNRRIRLVFDGVDFAYEVRLNGAKLGDRAGQFRRSEFDVSELLRFDQKNVLEVRIKRMPAELEHCFAASNGARSGAGTADSLIDCYTYMRKVLRDLKSPTNLGWDWGVNIYTLGIWRDVHLEATGPAAIESVWVRTEMTRDGRAIVKAHLQIDSQLALRAEAVFTVRREASAMSTVTESSVATGETEIAAQLTLDKPALWWPSGQGDQPLYELEVQLKDSSSGEELDDQRVRFGVRDIRWEQVEGAPPSFPNPYRLVVNGRPIRMMGSDMVPPDLLLGRDRDRGPRLLRLAKAAGMNTLRLWGGGVPLSPEFYDLADQLGIMLSQEFPLANSVPETDPVFLSNLRATATDIVRELRNHPAIIEWGGGNEIPWPAGPDHPALQVLKAVCASNDDRVFRPTDPIEGSMHAPWSFAPATHYEHYNSVDVMRYSEFGAQTPANLEVWKQEIPADSQWPLSDTHDPVLIRKNVLQAAFNPLDWLYKPVIEGYFGPLDNLEQLVPAGQFIGAEGLRYAIDELRRKGQRIGGITTWLFNEPWPNGAGTYMVGYDGRPLMNYDFVKEALSPISLTLRYSSNLYDPTVGIESGLWLVSDSPQAAHGLKWHWTARDRRGRVISSRDGVADIVPQEAREIQKIRVAPLPETALGPIFLELRLTDGQNKVLAERVNVFGADNIFVWPFEGMLRSGGQDGDDRSLLATRRPPIRVLLIQDWNDGRYEDMAWHLRRFGVRITHVPTTSQALGAALSDVESLRKNYDVIWLGSGNYKNLEPWAHRIGTTHFVHLSQAVHAGVGLALEGGWGSFAGAQLEHTALGDVLPVTINHTDGARTGGLAAVQIADPSNPLLVGALGRTFPEVDGYNVLSAKQDAKAVLRVRDGGDLLVTGAYGNGRVLVYASSLTSSIYQDSVDWDGNLRAWSGYPFFVARLMAWLSGGSASAVSAIDLPTAATRLTRPVQRTRLQWAVRDRLDPSGERLQIDLTNRGAMTALFCGPQPLRGTRADFMVENDHISIPPGEHRSINIVAPAGQAGEQGLAARGWKVSCWNADQVLIQPRSR